MKKQKIAIAMSGGVDSSVVAKILKDEGHDLVGLFLKLWSDPICDDKSCSSQKENRCCNYEALEDARKVAAKLNIPFYVIDAKKEFKKEIVDYFLEEYKNLRTPNPCIVCNEKIKFDLLLKKALAIGCEKLATGHYARIKCHLRGGGDPLIVDSRLHGNDGSYQLLKGIDETKDQSYMLYRLNQNQLSKVIFPLGEMTKKKVRSLAVKWNLPIKEKPESQEICFFADRDYRSFLRRHLPANYFKPGEIVDKLGNVIGKHNGLLNYTIGQRKGIEQKTNLNNVISRSSTLRDELSGLRLEERNDEKSRDAKPLYVAGFNVKKNQLIVGEDEDVFGSEMVVGNLNWIDPQDKSEKPKAKSLSVKIRYRHQEMACRIANSKPKTIKQFNNLTIKFDQSQRAITPGQSAVFYLGDEVLGGGIIEE